MFETGYTGAITFAHIFRKFRLRTVFICAQKCIAFAHNFSVTFAHMFSHFFLGQLLLFYYIKVRQIKYQHCHPCSRWNRSHRFTKSLKSQFLVLVYHIYILRHFNLLIWYHHALTLSFLKFLIHIFTTGIQIFTTGCALNATCLMK